MLFPLNLIYDALIFRRNPMVYLAGLFIGLAMIGAVFFSAFKSSNGPDYAVSDFAGDMAVIVGVASRDDRPALTAHLPPALPGWTRRNYLRTDGEQIVAGASGQGRMARVNAGVDLEQMGIHAARSDQNAAVTYIRGSHRIALGIGRLPSLAPPPQISEDQVQALWAQALADLRAGDLEMLVHGVPVVRRAHEDGTNPGYDRYQARLGGQIVIDVIANAPAPIVTEFLARIDMSTLQVQLDQDDPRVRRARGIVFAHKPETWPPELDQTGKHDLGDWIIR